jgi:serine/threonine protein kinase
MFEGSDGITAKLIDFGYASFAKSPETLIRIAPGTSPWQAPEFGLQTFTFDTATRMDVYSFGLLMCRKLLAEDLTEAIGRIGRCGSLGLENKLADYIGDLKNLKDDTFLKSVLKTLEGT